MLISYYQRRAGGGKLAEVAPGQRFGRRLFLRHAVTSGLSIGTASAFLAACSNTDPGGDALHSIDVMNVWSGEEQDSFKAVVAPFSQRTGILVTPEVTRNLDDALTMRLSGDNPPDIVILPNPGKMQELASQNHLIPLDSFLDMEQIRRDYKQSWLDMGSYKGRLYALFYKAANKGTIWYSPRQFQAQGYQLPTTWNSLITLSNQIARSGKYPWAMGTFSSGGSSGWPAADWIAQIYLNQNGGAMYDKWVAHQIPWTDPSIKQAFQIFGQIVGGDHYIAGAPRSVLTLDDQAASYLPFEDPPQAYMYYLGDFAEGFIIDQFKGIVPGTDFNFFSFPTLNPLYAGAITGGADVVVAMRDTPEVRQLVQYMATAQAQEIWVKRGGFTSFNRSVDLSAYPNLVARDSAQMLDRASIYRFGADDLMPPLVESYFWSGVETFIKDYRQLDSVLVMIERVAQRAYNGNL